MKRFKFDVILISSLVFIYLGILLGWYLTSRNKGSKAIVYHNDEVVCELDLAKAQTIKVEGDISSVTITVSYGKVYVSESGCKNQICVNSGKKSHENESITCLPNKIYVIIVGGN